MQHFIESVIVFLMYEQSEELKERIASGQYYEDARQWYSIVYMSLVSERFHYILLSLFGVVIMIAALSTLLSLLPLEPRQSFLYLSEDVAHTEPRLMKIRLNPNEDVDHAVRRHMLEQYLVHRESYDQEEIAMNNAVVFRHSDAATYERYRRMMDPTNPRSPMVLYEALAKRRVVVSSVTITRDDGQPSVDLGSAAYLADGDYKPEESVFKAVVKYRALVKSLEGQQVSDWVAQIKFTYMPVKHEVVMNASDNVDKLTIENMKFVVIDYTARRGS